MAQSTLNDEELFDEASQEMRGDVEEALEDAREALPEEDDVLNVEGDNIIGVLNSLNSGLEAGEAEGSLREAKKWFSIGKEADAFDDDFAEETDEDIAEIEDALGALKDAEESATDLTDAVASLKDTL